MKAFRQTAVFVLLPLLAVIIGAALSYHLYGEFGAKEDAQRHLQAAAQLAGTLMERDIAPLRRQLHTVLLDDSLDQFRRYEQTASFDKADAAREQLHEQLQRLLGSDPHCQSVALLDAHGDCLVVVQRDEEDPDLYDPLARPWFGEALGLGEFAGFETGGNIRIAVSRSDFDRSPGYVATMLYDFRPSVKSAAEYTLRSISQSELRVADRISQVLFQYGDDMGPDALQSDVAMLQLSANVMVRQRPAAALEAFREAERLLLAALAVVTVAILLVAGLGTSLVTRSLREAHRRIDEANRAKSEFLANMSHEIRTPMNGILGMLELLQTSEFSAQQREYLGLARESAESLLRILNDILDFSKIEAGKLELESAPFEFRKVVGSTAQALSQHAAAKNLRLTVNIDDAVPEELLGDSGRLRQVLVNLVGNAIKFTAEGDIGISADVAQRRGNGVSIHVAVRDTGIGIKPEQKCRIFEAFGQADTSTTREYGGTGLGLAIASELVQLMNGQIWVDSQIGAGSTFHFTAFFGVISAEPEEAIVEQGAVMGEAVEASTGVVRPARILLAEDGRINQKVAVSLLERAGHSVFVASNGLEAVQAAERERFDLLLMDVEMPELDGVQATMQIRAREKSTGKHLPIVALTAHAIKGDREKFLSAGMDDYLSKPVKPALLYEIVERYSSDSGNGSHRGDGQSPQSPAKAAQAQNDA